MATAAISACSRRFRRSCTMRSTAYGGFGSFIFNVDPSNQLRLMTSLRQRLLPDSLRSRSQRLRKSSQRLSTSIGLRDGEHETDAGVLFSWVHTFNSHLLTTVSPFYHYNSGDYCTAIPTTYPVATTEDRSFDLRRRAGQLRRQLQKERPAGRISQLLSERQPALRRHLQRRQRQPALHRSPSSPTANLEAFYIDDKFKPFSWLTLSAGMRPTRFSEGNFASLLPRRQSTNLPSARASAPLLPSRVCNWTFRAFYGHYYQAPPIETVSGPLIESLSRNKAAPSSRFPASATKNISSASPSLIADGSSTPTLSEPTSTIFSTTTTSARPTSFSPSPFQHAVIRGWELTLRSPRIRPSRRSFTSPIPIRSPKAAAPSPAD